MKFYRYCWFSLTWEEHEAKRTRHAVYVTCLNCQKVAYIYTDVLPYVPNYTTPEVKLYVQDWRN